MLKHTAAVVVLMIAVAISTIAQPALPAAAAAPVVTIALKDYPITVNGHDYTLGQFPLSNPEFRVTLTDGAMIDHAAAVLDLLMTTPADDMNRLAQAVSPCAVELVGTRADRVGQAISACE